MKRMFQLCLNYLQQRLRNKERVAEIFDLTNKLKNEYNRGRRRKIRRSEEIEQLIDEIHSSDLSDIPF